MKATIGELRPSDRITLVAHSQGGLISWIWYLNSLDNEPHLRDFHQMARQTEGLLTLGSPMWGSKLATFANQHPMVRKLLSKLDFKMGAEEVKELSYGSDTIFRFRRKAVLLDESGFKLPLRVLAIAGVLPKSQEPGLSFLNRQLLDVAEKYLSSGPGMTPETDLAVSLPSAQFYFGRRSRYARRFSKAP